MAKRTQSQLAKDAQDFIASVKAFGDPQKAEQEQRRKEEVQVIREENLSETLLSEQNSLKTEPKFFPAFEKRDNKSFWPQLKLTDFRKEAITFIETFYYTHKSLPNLSDFVLHFKDSQVTLPKGPADWEDFLLNIQEPLQNRGIPPYETPLDYLEPNFVLAVNLIVNAYDKRAIPAKLKEAGLTTKQWTGFLRQEKYQSYYRKRLDSLFDEDMVAESKLAVMRLIQANDLQAVKYYNELQNIYRPQESNQVQLILMAIMEILTLHVSPDVIGKVAEGLRQAPQLKAIEIN